MGHRTARFVGGVGRTLITLGVLVLLFAAFQLWGTGLSEQRAQDDLGDSFRSRLEAVGAASTSAPSTTSTTAAPTPDTTVPAVTTTVAPVVAPELAEELRPDPGETMGRIVMPTIGVDKYVVEGVRRSDLRKGPGHYPDSPLPGQAGNAAIAGHRTTYGAPFGDLDQLRPGDRITVETLQGTFHYEVIGHPGPDGSTVGYFIVGPDAVEVLDDVGDDRLTLTACHPKYSAAQRIVVTALMVGPPAPALPPPVPTVAAPAEDDTPAPVGDAGGATEDTVAAPDVLDETLGWNTDEVGRTLGWGAVTAAVAAVTVVVGRRWRRWPAWIVGAPLALVPLWSCFTHLDRLLPAL